MINIVRNIKPSLISLATATRSLDHDTLTILAETVLLAERRYIHKFRNDNAKENEWANELYADFAKQLGLKNDSDLNDFKVAGLAVMLSDDLNPHVDGMNPKGLVTGKIEFVELSQRKIVKNYTIKINSV